MSNIAIVVPTMESRKEVFKKFFESWKDLFNRHNVSLIMVFDDELPLLKDFSAPEGTKPLFTKHDILPKEEQDLLYNRNDGVRNLGFAYIAKSKPDIEYIITLDDDCLPMKGIDAIADHVNALNKRVPITKWINTLTHEYPRGFPYGIRDEAPVMVSHGVWMNIKDYDAPTQLVKGNPDTFFNKLAIPKGCFIPFCGMNVGFRRNILPYMYYAPMGPRVNLDRFADIWLGVELKKIMDEMNWAMVTGFSTIWHDKASNVWKNLQKEAKGLELNESFWNDTCDDPYFKEYAKQRERWYSLLESWMQKQNQI